MNIKEDLLKINQAIDLVSSLLYQQNDAEAYKSLAVLLESLERVLKELITIDAKNPSLELGTTKILEALMQAMQAMEAKDNVLVADILSYEIKEQFEFIIEKL